MLPRANHVSSFTLRGERGGFYEKNHCPARPRGKGGDPRYLGPI